MITINLDLPLFEEIHPLTLSDAQLIKLLKQVEIGKLIKLIDILIDEEFFNDDDKSWYKVQELMESYHQAKLDLLTIPVIGCLLLIEF